MTGETVLGDSEKAVPRNLNKSQVVRLREEDEVRGAGPGRLTIKLVGICRIRNQVLDAGAGPKCCGRCGYKYFVWSAHATPCRSSRVSRGWWLGTSSLSMDMASIPSCEVWTGLFDATREAGNCSRVKRRLATGTQLRSQQLMAAARSGATVTLEGGHPKTATTSTCTCRRPLPLPRCARLAGKLDPSVGATGAWPRTPNQDQAEWQVVAGGWSWAT